MNRSGQGQEPSSGLRRGLWTWILWVLASAVGGAVGTLASALLGVIGELFLFGAILGIAQSLVLRRCLREATELWAYASFFGWLAGWLVFVFLIMPAARELVPGIDQQAGSPIVTAGMHVAGTTLLRFVVWAVFGAFQGAVLASGHRALPPLAALWVVVGTLGGMLAVAADLFINTTGVFSGGRGDLFLGQIVPPVVMGTTAGALYGAVTGVVLALIVHSRAGG